MDKFIKQYSYNQIIEHYDVFIMSLEEFKQNHNNLANPKVIVCVDREGGVRKPKMPEWFKQWSENVYENKQPQWFKTWTKEVYEKQPPKWFSDYMEAFSKKNNLRFEKLENKLENVIKLNNLRFEKLETKLDNVIKLNNLKTE